MTLNEIVEMVKANPQAFPKGLETSDKDVKQYLALVSVEPDVEKFAKASSLVVALAENIGCKTLFATHYHELTELENTLPGTVNYSIAVKARGEDIIFLRKIVPGGADRSYGIEVAKLAGLPDKVVQRAKAVLAELEAENGVQYVAARKEADQVSLSAIGEGEVLDALRRCQPDTLTPIEAMSLLYELKQKLK